MRLRSVQLGCFGQHLGSSFVTLYVHRMLCSGFSLKYLRFLVVDEVDAFFNLHPFDWLNRIEESVLFDNQDKTPRLHPTDRLAKDLLRSDWVPLQKILVSATFPTTYEVLEPFHLNEPKLIISEIVFRHMENSSSVDMDIDDVSLMSIPKNIQISHVVCEEMDKPLLFLYFVLKRKLPKFLCFVKGLQKAEKLHTLAKKMEPNCNICFVSKLKDRKHAQLLSKFSRGEYQVIVLFFEVSELFLNFVWFIF